MRKPETPLEIALTYPFMGWVHPSLAAHLEGIDQLVTRLEATSYEIPKLIDLSAKEFRALTYIETLPRFASGQVVALPLLHPDLCDLLVAFAQQKAADYEVNATEEDAYQMPELVLQVVHPPIYHALLTFATNSLYKVMKLIWGRGPTRTESIQLARYNATGISGSGWHHDEDSNMTVVANLAPELFKGGGTDFRLNISTYVHVPPVDKGHALIFNGHQILHRGAPVASGERNILVWWCTSGR